MSALGAGLKTDCFCRNLGSVLSWLLGIGSRVSGRGLQASRIPRNQADKIVTQLGTLDLGW